MAGERSLTAVAPPKTSRSPFDSATAANAARATGPATTACWRGARGRDGMQTRDEFVFSLSRERILDIFFDGVRRSSHALSCRRTLRACARAILQGFANLSVPGARRVNHSSALRLALISKGAASPSRVAEGRTGDSVRIAEESSACVTPNCAVEELDLR